MSPTSRTCPRCLKTFSPAVAHCPHDGAALRVSPAAPWGEEPTVRHGAQPPAAADDDDGDATTEKKDPLVGAQLGDYVIREKLGSGGMGIVYWGEQPVIGKRVAIKILREEIARDPEQVKRLLDEARAVNSIRHRGIIDIFNFGQLPDGRHYVVMEFLDGESFDAYLFRRGPLPPGEAIQLLDEMLAALGAGHGAGIIHRDFKPSNVFMVRQPDGSHYLKLLDFGLAKQAAGPRAETPQTRTDMVVGTPEYIAPEQARGASIGPRTDLYAAGVVMFEMLTGRLPFDATSPMDWMIKHVEAQPPAPSAFVGGLPSEVDALVLRLLAKEPEQRPQSAEAVRRELNRLSQSMRQRAAALATAPVEPTAVHRPRSKAPEPASAQARASASRPRPGSTASPTAELAGQTTRMPAPASSLSGATAIEKGRGHKPIWIAAAVLVLCLGSAGVVLWRGQDPGAQPASPEAPRAEATAETKIPPGPPPPEPLAHPEAVDEPPPAEAPALVAEPADSSRPPPPKEQAVRLPREEGPTSASLKKELRRIARRVERSPPSTEPTLVKALLTRAHTRVERAKSPAERKDAAEYLRQLEHRFYGR